MSLKKNLTYVTPILFLICVAFDFLSGEKNQQINFLHKLSVLQQNRMSKFIKMIPKGASPVAFCDICLDPGHGGSKAGAVHLGVNEKDINLDIGLIAYENLQWPGGPYEVDMSRNTDVDVSFARRTMIANGQWPDANGWLRFASMFISIHNNSLAPVNTQTSGTETYFRHEDDDDEAFATCIQNNLYSWIGSFPHANDRGIKQANFIVLKDPLMDACLAECAFLTNSAWSNGQHYQLKENQGGFKGYIVGGFDAGIYTWITGIPVAPYSIRIMQPLPPNGPFSNVTIAWEASPSPSVTYSVYRREISTAIWVKVGDHIPGLQFTDGSAQSDKTYSYIVKAVDNNNIESHASDNVLVRTPPIEPTDTLATGYNNSHKAFIDSWMWTHLAYVSDTSAWYVNSTDFGATWNAAGATGEGRLTSALSLDQQQKPHVIWIDTASFPNHEPKSYFLYYGREKGNQSERIPLWDTTEVISAPGFDIGADDSGRVTFSVGGTNPGVYYGVFYTQDPIPQVDFRDRRFLDHGNTGRPSIGTRTSDASIHIAYEKSGIIYYVWRQNTPNPTWNLPMSIVSGENPSINVSGAFVHFIWERYEPDMMQTFIEHIYTDNQGWSQISVIATPSCRYCFPVIEYGSIATWHEVKGGNWEIMMSRLIESQGWTPPVNQSNTTAKSKYPAIANFQSIWAFGGDLVTVWTEGDNAPYELKVRHDVFGFMPLYGLDFGQGKAWPFTVQREGYVTYGNQNYQTVDYSTGTLSYLLTDLRPQDIYDLEPLFYYEGGPASYNQEITVNDQFVCNVRINSRIPKKVKIRLPPELYKDGEISLKIKSLNSSRAVVAGLNLWEYRVPKKAYAATKEQATSLTPSRLRFRLHPVAPNPAVKQTRMTFEIPKTMRVNIAIYNISGRTVRLLESAMKLPGIYTLCWDGRDDMQKELPSGVYFCELKNEKAKDTKKLILLK